jgi:hypothetical protein
MESGSAQIGPRSGGKILDLGFNIYFGNLSRLLLASAVIAVPLGLILIGINVVAFGEPGPGDELGLVEIGDTLKRVDYNLFTALQVAGIGVSIIAYLLIIGASYTAANEAYFSRPVSVRHSVGVALRRMHSLIWVSLLTAISIVLGLLALIVGAFVVYTLLAVTVPALLVEDRRGTKALRRSWNLVRNNGWRTFLVLVVAGIFTGLVQAVASLVGEVASGLADENIEIWVAIVQGLSALALAFAASFSAVITTVIYYDLRIRKEGFDIELMTERLEGGEGAEPGGEAPGRAWGEGSAPEPGSQPPPPPPPPPPG